MTARRILLLGGKSTLVSAVSAARQKGYYVIVADGNRNAPGLACADLGIHCDISDVSRIVELGRGLSIDGVLSLSEFGVVSAAHVAADLGLPSLSIDAALNATDKSRMRSSWRRDALTQPSFRIVRNDREARTALDDIGLPAVCKPCANAASRGVTRITRTEELSSAIVNAIQHDRTGRAILEECIRGIELSCEAFIVNGRLSVLAVADKDVEQDVPTCVTWSLTYPWEAWPTHEQRIQELLQAAASSLGITQGCCHAELISRDNEFYLLEMGARGGGGHIYSTIVTHVSGFDYVGASIDCAMGRAVDAQAARRFAACYRFLSAPPGTLKQIVGVDRGRSIPGVHDVGFSVEIGDRLRSVSNGAERPGWVVALGMDRTEVISAADLAARTVRFDVAADRDPIIDVEAANV